RRPPSTPTPATTRRATRQQQASVSLPGTLPSTPSPSSSPPAKEEPKEEPSPTASEVETSAALHLAPSSSPSESSSDSESSSSSDDLDPAHQNSPAIKSLGAYRLPRTTANQKYPNMSSTLPFHVDTDEQRPLAEIKVAKLKDCPMLTEGRMDDNIFQQWSIACHRYKKHSGKRTDEIVSFVADGMLEPRFVAWYHTNRSRIDAMTLDEYLAEFQRFALPRNWQSKVRDSILASFQENMSFANWNVHIQNLNARLTNTASEHALTNLALKAHFESHMRSDLRRKVDARRLKSNMEFADWIIEVTELDEELAEDRAQTQAMIDASNAERAAKPFPLAPPGPLPRVSNCQNLRTKRRNYSPNIKAVLAAVLSIATTPGPQTLAQ
ncbi:hypothetical protein C0992_005377, partial [Termitomyces sp. T32_za158]